MSVTFPPLDDTFPTLIPPFKTLVQHMNRCKDEGLHYKEAMADLRMSDTIVSAFAVGFKHSVAGYDYNDEEEVHIAAIYETFSTLGSLITNLFHSLHDNREEDAAKEITEIIDLVRSIEERVKQLHELGKQKPKLSPMGNVDAMLKAGKAIVEGRRDWSILQTRLESFRHSFDDLVTRTSMPLEMENYCDALDELYRVCENQDLEALPEVLELLKKASDELYAKYQPEIPQVQQANQKLLCPWCGVVQESWGKVCSSCHGRLPDRIPDTQGQPVRALNLPDFAKALFDAADKLRTGQNAWQEFRSAVAVVRSRANQTRTGFERLPAPAANTPQDELDALLLSKEAIQNGLEKFSQAIEIFDSLDPLGELDIVSLDCGLEAVIAGIEETRQVAVAMQRLNDGGGAAVVQF